MNVVDHEEDDLASFISAIDVSVAQAQLDLSAEDDEVVDRAANVAKSSTICWCKELTKRISLVGADIGILWTPEVGSECPVDVSTIASIFGFSCQEVRMEDLEGWHWR